MSSELQRAMQTVEDCVKRYGDEVDWVEWRRIRARLTPDRGRVTSALKRAYMPRFAPEELDLSRWDSWEKLADAAIDAMGETP